MLLYDVEGYWMHAADDEDDGVIASTFETSHHSMIVVVVSILINPTKCPCVSPARFKVSAKFINNGTSSNKL